MLWVLFGRHSVYDAVVCLFVCLWILFFLFKPVSVVRGARGLHLRRACHAYSHRALFLARVDVCVV